MKRVTIHKRSSVANQMPSSLEYGEIAVNYSANNEFLSIKNSSNSMVIFPSSGLITTAINNAVNNETYRAQSAETILENSITNETVRATSAETILETSITNEASARSSKDTELENAINEYKNTIAAALNELQNRTTSLESRVDALEP